ncbi:MAG: N-acetylglucosamine kinase [Bacteroidetes bacterium]|nr:N-acetylglucosamine kinase [Bacteroidota bacterium]MBS1739399.1 N-acetylglucosamine kinase [Bacteroidota bacterium]
MAALLLVESGSTKTDWCVVSSKGSMKHLQTSGINPYLQTIEQITELLKSELPDRAAFSAVSKIIFYGAGASQPEQQNKLKHILADYFDISNTEVSCDMMAAARGLCGNQKGIVCILGTGSNSCFFDGEMIKDKHPSLGYIAGDEGSGNYMGKRVLQYYAYHTFDDELRQAFEYLFGSNLSKIILQLYGNPFPNRYLAGFVQLLKENRGHYMVENIIEDSLNDFFHFHLMKFRESWKLPIHFTGSVAYEFKDVIANLCHQYEMELGIIEKSPLERLVNYHRELL